MLDHARLLPCARGSCESARIHLRSKASTELQQDKHEPSVSVLGGYVGADNTP